MASWAGPLNAVGRARLTRAKQSHADAGRNEVRELQTQLQFWQAAHHFIITGTVTKDEITCYRLDGTSFLWRHKPSPPTRAARRAYAQDPTCLDWDHAIDEDYLKTCLATQAPLLLDPGKCVQSSPAGFGRFHEQYLAQPALDFLNGDKGALLSVFGGTVPPPRSFWSSHPKSQELHFLEELTRDMTSDAAAQAKLILLRKTRGMRTTGCCLLHCDPEAWLTPFLAEYGSDSAMAGTALTAFATAGRPLTDSEQAILPKLLSLPCMRFSYKADQYARPPLARKYPDAFRVALQSPHISREVVTTALAEGLVDDRKPILERIEYGMLHDYEKEAEMRRPGRRSRGRRPARGRSARGPRIQTKWLDVVKTHFAGKEGIDFLHRIAQKPEFARGKSQIERAIKDMQKP